MDTQLTVVLIVLCLGLSAFFSASETAFFALQRVRVHHLVATGSARAKRVQRVKESPERFLATILLGNNLVNVAISALMTNLLLDAFGHSHEGIAVVVSVVVSTLGVVAIGEVVPKTIAAHFPEPVAFLFIGPLEIIEKALFPLAAVLSHGAAFMLSPVLRGRRRAPSVSEEEVQSLVKLGRAEGTFDETEADIINKTIRFADLRAREIMTPRTEIVWLERSTLLSDFLKVYAKTPHMRFPVYDGEQDNVVGILAVRDILRAFAEGRIKDKDRVATLARPAHFFPETKPLDALLKEMRIKHDQMVLLVDEHGSIAGLLTLQQIVGEVVGDITDEGTEADIQRIDERTIQIEGSMRVEEANARLSLGLPEGEYETLAGFLLSRLGRIPRQGEQISYDGLRFTVSEMRGVKIERVKVTRS